MMRKRKVSGSELSFSLCHLVSQGPSLRFGGKKRFLAMVIQ